MKTKTNSFHYHFDFPNGKHIEHTILLDSDNVLIQENAPETKTACGALPH